MKSPVVVAHLRFSDVFCESGRGRLEPKWWVAAIFQCARVRLPRQSDRLHRFDPRRKPWGKTFTWVGLGVPGLRISGFALADETGRPMAMPDQSGLTGLRLTSRGHCAGLCQTFPTRLAQVKNPVTPHSTPRPAKARKTPFSTQTAASHTGTVFDTPTK